MRQVEAVTAPECSVADIRCWRGCKAIRRALQLQTRAAYDSCHIIILDRDLLTVLAAQILDPRIMTTIIGGKIVYQRQ